MQRGLTTTCLV